MINKLMQAIRGLVALLAVSLAAAPGATVGSSEPMAWRYAHPEAQILAGVDFRKLAETADGKQIRDQFAAALGASMLDQAERLLLSSVVESNGRRSDVLILSGSFSLANLRKMAMKEGAKMVPYKGLEIAAPAGAAAGDPHLAWITGPVGGTTVLIGTRPAIQAAAERAKANVGAMASVNPLFARARDLTPQYPVWVVCDTVPQGIGPKSLDRFFEDGQELDGGGLEGFDIGLETGKAPNLNMWIWATTEAAAASVLKQFQASASTKEVFVLSSWLQDLKGTLEGSTLVLGAPVAPGSVAGKVGPLLASFALPVDINAKSASTPAEAQIAVRAKVDATVPMTGVTSVTLPAPVPSPVAAPPPAPKKMFVRIEGLDEGAKDIPYTAKP